MPNSDNDSAHLMSGRHFAPHPCPGRLEHPMLAILTSIHEPLRAHNRSNASSTLWMLAQPSDEDRGRRDAWGNRGGAWPYQERRTVTARGHGKVLLALRFAGLRPFRHAPFGCRLRAGSTPHKEGMERHQTSDPCANRPDPGPILVLRPLKKCPGDFAKTD